MDICVLISYSNTIYLIAFFTEKISLETTRQKTNTIRSKKMKDQKLEQAELLQ